MRNCMQRYREAVDTLAREFRAQQEKNDAHIRIYFDSRGQMREDVALYRKCNICGSGRKASFLKPTPYTFVKCLDCGFRYMDPIVDPASTSILTEGISRQRRTVIRDPQWNRRHQKMTQQVREILSLRKGGSFLDVGCGLGRHMRLALPHFSKVEGIELDKISLAYCREGGLRVHGDPLEDLHLADDEYDVVLMNQVIEHLADPRATCREIYRILRPGGILYIDTPNFSSLSMALFKEHCSVVRGSGHISLFDMETVLALLRSEGFSILRARTYQTDLFPLDVLTYLLSRKRFVHRRNLFIPLYLPLYRIFHEVFEERVFVNLGWRLGSYMRVVATKDTCSDPS